MVGSATTAGIHGSPLSARLNSSETRFAPPQAHVLSGTCFCTCLCFISASGEGSADITSGVGGFSRALAGGVQRARLTMPFLVGGMVAQGCADGVRSRVTFTLAARKNTPEENNACLKKHTPCRHTGTVRSTARGGIVEKRHTCNKPARRATRIPVARSFTGCAQHFYPLAAHATP